MDRRQQILKHAIALFAERGVDATTTLQIAEVAGVTEPLVFYYFNNKDGLFAEIINMIFDEYFSRLDNLMKPQKESEFTNIRLLIEMHLNFVEEMPAESYLVISACPAKLKDSAHICTKNIEEQRNRIISFLTKCIKRGVQNKEFYNVPVEGTVRLIIALINGVMRQEVLSPSPGISDLDATDIAVNFCKRALVK